MSRSRKRVPVFADRNPWAKREANRKVRRFHGDVSDGKWYRKLYNPYNIKDFWWDQRWGRTWPMETWDEFMERRSEDIARAYRK
jgi:hypothetical protein